MVNTDRSKYENLHDTEIIIWCAGKYANEVFNQGEKLGWNIRCFCDIQKEKQGTYINGLLVCSFADAYEKYSKAVVVIAHSDYSECLRIGRKLEGQGFVKNQTYFIAIDLETAGLLPIIGAPFQLKDRKMILLGPTYLCDCFKDWVGGGHKNLLEMCSSEEHFKVLKQKYPDALWIPLFIETLGTQYWKKLENYKNFFNNQKLWYTEYFLNHLDYCDGLHHAGSAINMAGSRQNDSVKMVLFNVSFTNVGISFLNGILDSHPNVLYFGLEMYVWTNNLWEILQIVKRETGGKIVEKIVQKIRQYTLEAWDKNVDAETVISLPNRDLFWLDHYQRCLHLRINEERQYTERELLIAMHLAWKEANGMAVNGKETVIYIDIHVAGIPGELHNMYVRWLERLGFDVVLMQMIRRPYMQSASIMKIQKAFGNFQADTALWAVIFVAYEELYGELKQHKILRLRFEDVKQYPAIVLKKFCKELKIEWSESMLETTSAGKMTKCKIGGEEIKGYDMKPVWYPYDEFFDAFDKFRMDILCREKCKAYDYPYVSEEKYPMPLSKLVDLFELPFQFEKYIDFANEGERAKFRSALKEECKKVIYWQENKEHRPDLFCFGTYLGVSE